MRLRVCEHTIELRRDFTLAGSARSTTPAVIVELEHEGTTGYGEAALPPYMGETVGSVTRFIASVKELPAGTSLDVDSALDHIGDAAQGNAAAKAALDIALHDWAGKRAGMPLHRIWTLDPAAIAPSSYTISIADRATVRGEALGAEGWRVLKVKLGRDNDREMIDAIREVTDKPIRVDVNQGWLDSGVALRMAEWLAGRGVELIEQPFPADAIEQTAWLRERSPIPIVADEAVRGPGDIERACGVYDGINVKLMKCGGLRETKAMIRAARSRGLKVMIGCMTETSCAISAAAQLSALADWIDLDGAALTVNDPFRGAELLDGRMVPGGEPGIGALPVRGMLRFHDI